MIRASSASALAAASSSSSSQQQSSNMPLPLSSSPVHHAASSKHAHLVATFADNNDDEKENLNLTKSTTTTTTTQQRKQQQHLFLQQLYLHHQKIKQQQQLREQQELINNNNNNNKQQQQQQQNGKPVKYGELIVLGYNGCIGELNANGDEQQQQRVGRRKSKYVLERRDKPNGVKPSTQHNCKSSLEINNCLSANNNNNMNNNVAASSLTTSAAQNHSVTYTLSRTHTVVVKYAQDERTDMFQIGRSTESSIDFIVLENANSTCSSTCSSAAANQQQQQQQQSTISRYAARITVEREPPYTARIYAAGFDASKRIFLGEKATKWTSNDDKGELDGVTTNGVLIMHPNPSITTNNSNSSTTKLIENTNNNEWLEVSVCGAVFTLKDSRLNSPLSSSSQSNVAGLTLSKKCLYNNILKDGTLIDLCGATLMWRSCDSLAKTADKSFLDANLRHLNKIRPQCPVGLKTLIFPSSASPLLANGNQKQAKNRRYGLLNKSTDSTNSNSSGSNLFVVTSSSLNSLVGSGNHELERGRSRSSQHHTTRIPMVYLRCGHVHGQHDWGMRNRSVGVKGGPSEARNRTSVNSSSLDLESAELDLRECPLCRKVGPYVRLVMGLEPSIYFDEIKVNNAETTTNPNYFKPYALVPCGHMASELTCKYWSRVKVPQGSTQGLFSICPFCAKQLDPQQPFIKLIFQEGC